MTDDEELQARFVENIFSTEIRSQCEMILAAADDLNDELSRGRDEIREIGVARHVSDIWRHLQTILVAASNLSKIFWGSQGAPGNESESRREVRLRREAEREPLRRKFQVADDSPLKDTDLRNDFEHFDERLEAWVAEHPGGNYVGRNIGSPTDIHIEGEPEHQRFQHFDPATGIVTFWAHSVSLGHVLDEARRLLDVSQNRR